MPGGAGPCSVEGRLREEHWWQGAWVGGCSRAPAGCQGAWLAWWQQERRGESTFRQGFSTPEDRSERSPWARWRHFIALMVMRMRPASLDYREDEDSKCLYLTYLYQVFCELIRCHFCGASLRQSHSELGSVGVFDGLSPHPHVTLSLDHRRPLGSSTNKSDS